MSEQINWKSRFFFLSQNKFQEELEQNKRRTERKMRNSLANIQFHEAQKQTLLGKMDFAENQWEKLIYNLSWLF